MEKKRLPITKSKSESETLPSKPNESTVDAKNGAKSKSTLSEGSSASFKNVTTAPQDPLELVTSDPSLHLKEADSSGNEAIANSPGSELLGALQRIFELENRPLEESEDKTACSEVLPHDDDESFFEKIPCSEKQPQDHPFWNTKPSPLTPNSGFPNPRLHQGLQKIFELGGRPLSCPAGEPKDKTACSEELSNDDDDDESSVGKTTCSEVLSLDDSPWTTKAFADAQQTQQINLSDDDLPSFPEDPEPRATVRRGMVQESLDTGRLAVSSPTTPLHHALQRSLELGGRPDSPLTCPIPEQKDKSE